MGMLTALFDLADSYTRRVKIDDVDARTKFSIAVESLISGHAFHLPALWRKDEAICCRVYS